MPLINTAPFLSTWNRRFYQRDLQYQYIKQVRLHQWTGLFAPMKWHSWSTVDTILKKTFEFFFDLNTVIQKPRNAGIGNYSKIRYLQTIFSYLQNCREFSHVHIVFADIFTSDIHLIGNYEYIVLFLCFAQETIWKFADKSRENSLAFKHIQGFLQDLNVTVSIYIGLDCISAKTFVGSQLIYVLMN